MRAPVFAEPLPDEALCSWLCRLAGKLGMAPGDFVRMALGIVEWKHPQWWRRPSRDAINRLTCSFELDTAAINAMTMADWTTAHADEISRRFQPGRAYRDDERYPYPRPLAVCPQCLAEDRMPYIRREWMIGWLGACARHGAMLREHCHNCGDRMRLAGLGSRALVRIGDCPRCGTSIAPEHRPAHPLVLALQSRLLACKHRGRGPLPPMGPIAWSTAVDLIDLVRTIIWTDTSEYTREELFELASADLGVERLPTDWVTNYGVLLLLGWLLERWEERLETALHILRRPALHELITFAGGSSRPRQRRLEACLPEITNDSPTSAPVWQQWLDTLPASDTFREIAWAPNPSGVCQRRFGVTTRILALADLRDGVPVEAVSNRHWVAVKAVERWIDMGRAHGVEVLLNGPKVRRSIDDGKWGEMRNWLSSVDRRASPHGWSPGHVQAEVCRVFGLMISLSAARALMWGIRF